MSHLLAILREMCKDRANLDDTFISVHDAIGHELNCRECGKSGPITIAVFCPWVKHRSKALARLLYHIISCRGGLAVDLPIHLSSKDCGCCMVVAGCCRPGAAASQEKLDLLDRAYRRYMPSITTCSGGKGHDTCHTAERPMFPPVSFAKVLPG